MIWVLLLLNVNLPTGTIAADQIAGSVFLTEVECLAERVKLTRFVLSNGGNLNIGCIKVDNVVAPPARPRVQS